MMTSQLGVNWRSEVEKAADESNEEYEAEHGEEENTEKQRMNGDSVTVTVQRWMEMMKTVENTVWKNCTLTEEYRKVMKALQKTIWRVERLEDKTKGHTLQCRKTNLRGWG